MATAFIQDSYGLIRQFVTHAVRGKAYYPSASLGALGTQTVAGLKAALNALTTLDQSKKFYRDEYVKSIQRMADLKVILDSPGTMSGAQLETATSGGSLLDNTTYYFKLTAVDASGGETTPGGEFSKATGAAGDADDNTITLKNLTAVSGRTSYRLYFSLVSGTFTSGYFAVAAADIEGAGGHVFSTVSGATAATIPSVNTARIGVLTDAEIVLAVAASGDKIDDLVDRVQSNSNITIPDDITWGDQWE